MSRWWLVGAAVLATAAMALPASADPHDTWRDRAQARSRDWRGDRTYGRGGQTFQIGFDKGYEDGLKHGRSDGDHRRSYDFRHDDRYRDGDHGYKSHYGPRYDYVQGYRRGYESGYNDGYQAYRYDDRGHRGYGRDGYGRDGYGRDGGRVIYETPDRDRDRYYPY